MAAVLVNSIPNQIWKHSSLLKMININ